MGRSTSNRTASFGRLLAVSAMSLVLIRQAHAAAPQLEEPVIRDDRYLPEPPRQQDEWKAPTSDLPWEFANAVRVLCRQGFADPRGCDYCEIQAATNSDISAHAPHVRTHGWVLLQRDAQGHSYAVCWNGLVYPRIKVGPKADLDRDVKAFIDAHELGKLIDEDGPRADDERSMWHGNLGDPGAALLLRLGRGDLAAELWFTKHPNRAEFEPSDTHKFDPYVALAQDWSSLQFKRATQAWEHREYPLALYAFRKLGRFAETAEAEAKQRGFKPSDKEPLCFKCLEQSPEFLRDLEYRAPRWPLEPIVCIGPGKCSDQKKRIASLIDRLDEVNPPRIGISMRGDMVLLDDDVVVRALIVEGAPALEPLMECFKHDDRLTRSRESETRREAPEHRMSVRKAAYAAMCDILDRSDLAANRNRIVTNAYDDSCRELAALLDEPIKQAKQYSRVERLYQRLADDKATPEQWHEAAKILLSPRERRQAMPFYGIRGSEFDQPDTGDPDKLVGESLRDKNNPSVTDLVLKRIKQAEDPEITFDLVCALARWDAKTAQEPLAEQMQRLLEKAEGNGSGRERSSFDDHAGERYVELVERRTKLGDKRALDDYAAAISNATRTNFHQAFPLGAKGPYRFAPMADHADHPAIKKAAEKLFADHDSPWVPLGLEDTSNQNVLYTTQLVDSKLLRHEAFRKAVMKELANTAALSTVKHLKDGSTYYSLAGCSMGYGSATPPLEDITQEFRVCDYCAYMISRISGAPRCELFWTEAERDKAVAACAEFLRKQQYELSWHHDTLKLDKPATRDQVAKSEAVFSLEGEEQVRVVKGLKLPLNARWTTLKDNPTYRHETDPKTGAKVPVIEYEQGGEIVQAEEVFNDGKWQRYYGFIGAHRLARVKAEEIDLSPDRWDQEEWFKVADTLHARLELSASTAGDGYYGRYFSSKEPVSASLMVRNASGLDQKSPSPEKLVRLRLLYSPETLSRQGELVPKSDNEKDWQEVTRKPDAKFKIEKADVLIPAQKVKIATVDLRDWFDMTKPGFYRLQLLPTDKQPNREVDVPPEVRFSLARK